MSIGEPLISCLCITHRRVAMLERAVHCFLSQTWPARELLVLHEDVDHDTRDFIAKLAHPLVRSLVVPAQPHLALGSKRQVSVEAARGDWVATWDDDDWSGPTRLAEQMQVLRESGQPVCTLERWVAYDRHLGEAWLCAPRPWEASLLVQRAVLPRYQALERGSDRVSMEQLVAAGQVVTLRRPHLYIYLYHGGNVGSRGHFRRNVFAQARKLPPAFAQRVARVLASPQEPPLQMAELQAAASLP